jgi:hypothetical protein
MLLGASCVTTNIGQIPTTTVVKSNATEHLSRFRSSKVFMLIFPLLARKSSIALAVIYRQAKCDERKVSR